MTMIPSVKHLSLNNRIKIKSFYYATLFILIQSLPACTTPKVQLPSSTELELRSNPAPNLKSSAASGRNAAIATAHPLASEAAMQILQSGGNALDAAITASFVLSVVRPQSTGIGGGGFMLYYSKDDLKTVVYDFRERAPRKASRNMYLHKTSGDELSFSLDGKTYGPASVDGPMAVGIPGLVAGLYDAHAQNGLRPWSELIKPAIQIAENGFPVYKSLHQSIIKRKDILSAFPSSKEIFLPDGEPLAPGDLLRQKDLAQTLRQIAAHGKSAFYTGIIAEKISLFMSNVGGLIDNQDLKEYRTKNRPPVIGYYRGHKIVSMPPPSSGGVHIVQMLNMLENENLGGYSHNSPKYIHLLSEVMKRAFADRAKYLGDPDFYTVPIALLTSKEYARSLYAGINHSRATPSMSLKTTSSIQYESPSTTHFSIVDRWGNAVSSTQTINYTFGSGMVASGTGIILNNEMDDFSKNPGVPNVYGLIGGAANEINAGKTMLSSMSPSIVFDRNNQLRLVVGSPGGPRIINATLQTMINVLDHDMDLEKAVTADRIHHQWLPDQVRVEKHSFRTSDLEAIRAFGHNVVEKKGKIGDVQAIEKRNGIWTAVSDHRSDGKPVAY